MSVSSLPSHYSRIVYVLDKVKVKVCGAFNDHWLAVDLHCEVSCCKAWMMLHRASAPQRSVDPVCLHTCSSKNCKKDDHAQHHESL